MRNLLLILFAFFSLSMFAQKCDDNKQYSKPSINSFTVAADSVDELKNFDWEMVKSMLEPGSEKDSISIKVKINLGDNDITKRTNLLKNFSATLYGVRSAVPFMVDGLKSTVDLLIEPNESLDKQ